MMTFFELHEEALIAFEENKKDKPDIYNSPNEKDFIIGYIGSAYQELYNKIKNYETKNN